MEGKTFTLGYHLVAIIDVLGQRDKFRSLQLPKNAEQEAQAKETLANTAGYVLRLRDLFKQQFEIFETGLTHPIFAKQVYHAKFVGFSDSFVVSFPLRNDKGDLLPVVVIHSLLNAASIVMLSSLAWKHALEGELMSDWRQRSVRMKFTVPLWSALTFSNPWKPNIHVF